MEFKVFDLGLVDFKNARQIEKEIFNDVKNGHLKAALILCQHYPVITLGRKALAGNVTISATGLNERGIQIYAIDRGGDVTYHGPGQIIAYPVFNLNYLKKDIHLFLRQLEEVVIKLLSLFKIQGLRYAGLTGVWIDTAFSYLTTALYGRGPLADKQKIASIGIAIKNWITFHGLSINIKKDDLDNFRLIRPCGMDIKMTSLETILNRTIEIEEIKEKLIHKFQEIFS